MCVYRSIFDHKGHIRKFLIINESSNLRSVRRRYRDCIYCTCQTEAMTERFHKCRRVFVVRSHANHTIVFELFHQLRHRHFSSATMAQFPAVESKQRGSSLERAHSQRMHRRTYKRNVLVTIPPCIDPAFGVQSYRVRPTARNLRDKHAFHCLDERRFDFVNSVIVPHYIGDVSNVESTAHKTNKNKLQKNLR